MHNHPFHVAPPFPDIHQLPGSRSDINDGDTLRWRDWSEATWEELLEDTHNLGIFQLFGVQSHGEEILEKTTSIEARLTFHLPVLGIHNSRLLQQRSPHREALGPLEVHIDETSDACSAKRAFGSKHMPRHKICLPQHLYCRRRLWREFYQPVLEMTNKRSQTKLSHCKLFQRSWGWAVRAVMTKIIHLHTSPLGVRTKE